MTARRTRTLILAASLGIAATAGVVVFTRGPGGKGRTEPAVAEEPLAVEADDDDDDEDEADE